MAELSLEKQILGGRSIGKFLSLERRNALWSMRGNNTQCRNASTANQDVLKIPVIP